MGEIASLIYSLLCLGIIAFQVGLISGAPWGRLTQGGQNEGALPVAGRAIAALSIALLAAMALAVTSRAGLWPNWPAWTVWPALALQALTTVLNAITPSGPERRLWLPITLVMLALAVFVAFGGHGT